MRKDHHKSQQPTNLYMVKDISELTHNCNGKKKMQNKTAKKKDAIANFIRYGMAKGVGNV